MRTYVAKGEEAEAQGGRKLVCGGCDWRSDWRSAGTPGDQGRAHADGQGQTDFYAVPRFGRPCGGDQCGQGSHDRKQGRAESLLFAQRISRRIKRSAGKEIARIEVGLDDP